MTHKAQHRLRLVTSSPPKTLPERRRGQSQTERTLGTLHRAVAYLMAERARREHVSLEASQEALAELCAAVQRVTEEDRREGTRRSTLRWLWDAIPWTR